METGNVLNSTNLENHEKDFSLLLLDIAIVMLIWFEHNILDIL